MSEVWNIYTGKASAINNPYVYKYEDLIFEDKNDKVVFSLDGFKNGKFTVRCKTEEEAKNFLTYLYGYKITWSSGDILIVDNIHNFKTHWECCDEYIVYGYNKKGIIYADIIYGKKCINYEDLEFEKENTEMREEMNNLGNMIMRYFNLELGDTFRFHGILDGTIMKFVIDKEGRTILNSLKGGTWVTLIKIDLDLFLKINSADVEIVEKAPFIPAMNEAYYYIDGRYGDVNSTNYSEFHFDILNVKLRNCFKSREQAEQNREKLIAILKSMKKLVEVD